MKGRKGRLIDQWLSNRSLPHRGFERLPDDGFNEGRKLYLTEVSKSPLVVLESKYVAVESSLKAAKYLKKIGKIDEKTYANIKEGLVNIAHNVASGKYEDYWGHQQNLKGAVIPENFGMVAKTENLSEEKNIISAPSTKFPLAPLTPQQLYVEQEPLGFIIGGINKSRLIRKIETLAGLNIEEIEWRAR